MKYFIAYLLKGKAEKYHRDLAKKISEKFKLKLLSERIPAHFTLKAPFETEKIGEIEKVIERVSVRHKAAKLRMGGFSQFHKRVVFLDAKAIMKATIVEIHKDLIRELKKIKWLKWRGRYDGKLSLHATLAYTTKRNFDDIWAFLSEQEKKQFDAMFDNIAIMKKVDGKWRVYKEYSLRKA